MSVRGVLFSPLARDDLRDAVLWYQTRDQRVAEDFRAAVRDAIESLSTTNAHPAADAEGSRKWLLKRFPFSFIYELGDDTITIVAVAHHRRRPRYWKRQ